MDKVHKSTQLVSGDFILVKVKVPTNNCARICKAGVFYPPLEWKYIDDCVLRVASVSKRPTHKKNKTYVEIWGEVIENFGRINQVSRIGGTHWIRLVYRVPERIAFKLTKSEATIYLL